jgi:uncharacterized SAM-binding protein YcdF (DUF218 family)
MLFHPMLFQLSKIAGAMLAPGTLLLFITTLALLWHRRRPRLSRVLPGAVVLALAALTIAPGAFWLIEPLEQRFAATPLPERVDGIIVLGGAIEPAASSIAHQPELNGAAERVTVMVALARRYPGAKLVYSGGSGSLRNQQHREADVARSLLQSLGVDTQRVIFERDSRNTWENAIDSKKLVQPQAADTWLLVTSAWHMPRAVGRFRAAGWKVVPYPVDSMGLEARNWGDFETGRQLYIASPAVKEWIGLASYRLLGRTDAWFPGP